MEVEDGITQEDLDIVISVSVVVTAVVIVTVGLIIYRCGDGKWYHPVGSR